MQGGRRDLSRSDVEDRTCSTGSSCSTILERVEGEKEGGRVAASSSESAIEARTYIPRVIAIDDTGDNL